MLDIYIFKSLNFNHIIFWVVLFTLYWGPNGLPNGFWVMSYNPKPIVGSKQWTQNPFWVGLG